MDRTLEGAPLLGSINNQPMRDISHGGKGAGVFGSILNLTNTLIGAGLLAVPFAFRMSGMGLGLIFLLMMYVVSALSFDSLARAAQYCGVFTYKEIALKTYGPGLALIAELFILLYTFLNLVARPIILTEYLVTIFTAWLGQSYDGVLIQRWFFIIVVCVVIFPLTMLRNIDPLKYSSFFSLLCVVFTSVVVVYMFGTLGSLETKIAEAQFWPDSVSALIALGILVVSFCAHYNAPRMYQELERRSISRFRVVIICSMTICMVLYATVGVTGYLSCLDLTQGDVLDDYAGRNILVTVARASLIVALIFSTPLVLFACRRSFLVVFIPNRAETAPFWLWILISAIILFLAGVIAYLLPRIDIIFGFSGALVGVAFVFLIPGIFFVLISRRMRNQQGLLSVNATEPTGQDGQPSRRVVLGTGFFLIVFAALMTVLGTTGAVFRVVNPPNVTTLCANVTDWSKGPPLANIFSVDPIGLV